MTGEIKLKIIINQILKRKLARCNSQMFHFYTNVMWWKETHVIGVKKWMFLLHMFILALTVRLINSLSYSVLLGSYRDVMGQSWSAKTARPLKCLEKKQISKTKKSHYLCHIVFLIYPTSSISQFCHRKGELPYRFCNSTLVGGSQKRFTQKRPRPFTVI